MTRYDGKRVAVVGAGRSGRACVRFLLSRGAVATLFDEKALEALIVAGGPLPEGSSYEARLPQPSDAAAFDMVVVSPGVPTSRLPMDAFRAAGVSVFGELELAFRSFGGKVAAVTGTNGKSTVTTLLGLMASEAGLSSFTGGNLGTPFIEAADDASQWAVVEVSSFQLDTIDTFRPAVAVLINITEDHADRYDGFERYAVSKMRIFRNMERGDAAVVNVDDPEVATRIGKIQADIVPVSLIPNRSGAFFDGTDLVLRDGGTEERYPRKDVRIKGRQNVQNALCAMAAARRMGVSESIVRSVLASFPGLSHRIEFVREVGGVSWYNDSKGTNVGAVVAAVEGFDEKVVLLAGGKDKGVDFTPLRTPLKARARGVVLFGQAAGRMEREIEGVVQTVLVDTLDEAVKAAAEMARPGDAAVLSPACSSFDQFRDFEHRGEEFRRAVKEL